MNFLALDFDGVICDSQDECFHTAGVTFESIYLKGLSLGNFVSDNIQKLRELRHLAYSGEDFFFILFAIFNSHKIKSYEDLSNLKIKNKWELYFKSVV